MDNILFRISVSYLVSRVSYFVNQSCLAFEISIFMGSLETITPLSYLKFGMTHVTRRLAVPTYPPSAAAPPTISESSLVMASCLALL